MKVARKFVYPEKGKCPVPPLHAKWNNPDEVADMLYIQTIPDLLSSDQDIQYVSPPGHYEYCMIKMASFMGHLGRSTG